MNKDLQQTLSEYSELLVQRYRDDAYLDTLRKRMDELIKTERRIWTNKVRALDRKRRPGWGTVSSRCFWLIDHSTKPCGGCVMVEITALRSGGRDRGQIELCGTIDQADDILAEARRILVGEVKR